MYFFVDLAGKDKGTADIKAPADMSQIMDQRGYQGIPFKRPPLNSGKISNFLVHLSNWLKVNRTIKKNDVLIYQYPLGLSRTSVIYLKIVKKAKKLKIVYLIHDIDSLRGYNVQKNHRREALLHEADGIICHNEKMKEWLVEQGICSERIVSLGIFDYLMEDTPYIGNDIDKVIIAGNLGVRKSPYIGELLSSPRKYHLNLFGPFFEEKEEYSNYTYYGSFAPDELISNLKGSYGLVWDGDSLEECNGMTGNYLRYNNPHKVSLYVASGIPVIIWKQAALADYVESNNIGLTVNNLKEIDDILSGITKDSYELMKNNIAQESNKLRAGYYLNRALDQIEIIVNI